MFSGRVKMKRKHLRSALIVPAVVPITPRVASAATDYFWFQPSGGSGPWDTTSQNWSSVTGVVPDHVWNNSATERGNFVTSFGTITLDAGGITSAGIVF